jgi:hypothetical protein
MCRNDARGAHGSQRYEQGLNVNRKRIRVGVACMLAVLRMLIDFVCCRWRFEKSFHNGRCSISMPCQAHTLSDADCHVPSD